MFSFISGATLGEGLFVFAGATVVYLLAQAVYHVFFHPLAKYPGPFLAKVSAIPSFYHTVRGDRHLWIWRQHETYGDKVRLAPNEIVFNNADAAREIYGPKANVKKASYYHMHRQKEDDLNTWNVTDRRTHQQKRRVLNMAFSERAVRSAEPFVLRNLSRWCELIAERSQGGDWSAPVNMAKLNDELIFDILCDLAFGKSFEIKEKGENSLRVIPGLIHKYMTMQHILSFSPMVDSLVWLKFRGLYKLMDAATPGPIKAFQTFLEAAVAQRIKAEQDIEAKRGQGASIREDMFHFLFRARDPEKEEQTGQAGLSRHELESEAKLLVIAGSDTTVITICGLVFYLTQDARVYEKLTREIRGAFSSVDEIVSSPALASCAYMRACINEALRMTPAVPSELLREVLPGGQTLGGQTVPAGVQVGVSTWSLHYNAEYFPDPLEFRPERWIVAGQGDAKAAVTDEDVARAHSAFFPFSYGPRGCVGKNLALMELNLTVARLLYSLDVRRAPGSNVGGGSEKLAWGRENPNIFQLKDAFIGLRDGPLVQFRRREQL